MNNFDQLRKTFFLQDGEVVVSVQCNLDCSEGAGGVADTAEGAFLQVNVNCGFLGFSVCVFGLLLCFYGFFGTGETADLAADATVFVKG